LILVGFHRVGKSVRGAGRACIRHLER
jgi:hypothetical protein